MEVTSMTENRQSDGATAAHPLLAEVVRRLHVHEQWLQHTAEGTAFVVTETGCWLSIADEKTLHIEIRVAVDVRDAERAAVFCDDRNHLALLGRWLHDPTSGIVALVADLPIGDGASFDVPALATELVAELLNAAGTVQFMSAPQRDLDGYKAVPALHGEICLIRNPTDAHLPNHTYLRGAEPDVAEETLILAQDIMLIPLLGWAVEHEMRRTIAEHPDGSLLLMEVAPHPHAGWGLVASLRPPWTADVNTLNTLNAADGSAGLTHWTLNGEWVENRLFVPNATLEAAIDDTWGAAQFVVAIIETLSNHRGIAPEGVCALQRPAWPGDDLTTTYRRRRDLWNDFRDEDDPEWYAIFLDVFGRTCTLTEPSYRRWYARLDNEDLAHDGTRGFISFMEARMHDRDERLGLEGVAEDDYS
jgi:hypothetical protein